MNDRDVLELLERAAGSVRPTVTEPGPRLVDLGRRRERRRRRVRAAGGAVLLAVAVAAGVATAPRFPWVRDASPALARVVRGGTHATFGSLALTLPAGWQVRAGQDVDVCTAQPQTVVTGWLHKRRDCVVPESVVLLAAEPLVVGDPAAPEHRLARDDGSVVRWQQTWIRGYLAGTGIDGYLLTVPDGRQVFVTGSSTQTRDAVAAGLSW
jgi:hypothetical protein